jgi:hypothetical protein
LITCTITALVLQYESHISGRQSTNHLLGDHPPLIHSSLQSTSYGADELSNFELHGQVCKARGAKKRVLRVSTCMCHHHRHIFATADLLFIRERVDPILIQSKHALRARVMPHRRLTSRQKTSQVKNLQNASEGIIPLEGPYGCTFASTMRVTPYSLHGGGRHGLDYLRRTRSGASAAVTTCW